MAKEENRKLIEEAEYWKKRSIDYQLLCQEYKQYEEKNKELEIRNKIILDERVQKTIDIALLRKDAQSVSEYVQLSYRIVDELYLWKKDQEDYRYDKNTYDVKILEQKLEEERKLTNKWVISWFIMFMAFCVLLCKVLFS